MSHPKNKRDRIIYRNKKQEKIKKISHYGYNPYVGWPVYSAKQLQNKNYIRSLNRKFLQDYRNMSGIFSNQKYYIKHLSRGTYRKFIKRYANKITRRKEDLLNYSSYKKNYPVMWELL